MPKPARPLSLETLESRWNPAGTVTGTFSRGTWTITGDSADNLIVINPTATPNQFVLAGNATTVLGVTNPSDVKNIVVKLFEGADSVRLANNTGTPAVLAGSLKVKGGTDANSVAINGMNIAGNVSVTNGTNESGFDYVEVTDSRILGKVKINNGDGSTFFEADRSSAGSSFIGKGLSITSGEGTDYASIKDHDIGGNVTINFGLPGNGGAVGQAEFYNSFNQSSRSVFSGNVKLKFKAGTGGVSGIFDAEVMGNVTINNGESTSQTFIDAFNVDLPVVIHGSLSIIGKGPSTAILGAQSGLTRGNGLIIGKNLTISGRTREALNATITLDKVAVGGNTKIYTGAGADTITIDDSVFYGFQLLTGSGADIVNVEQKAGTASTTQFLGKTKVDLGGGADLFNLGSAADATRQVEFFGKSTVSGGKDSDFDTINRNNLLSVFYTPSYDFDNVI